MVIATTRLGELGNHGDSLQQRKVCQYFQFGRGAKCVESQELTAVLLALSPKIKRQLGLGHLTPVDLRRKRKKLSCIRDNQNQAHPWLMDQD